MEMSADAFTDVKTPIGINYCMPAPSPVFGTISGNIGK